MWSLRAATARATRLLCTAACIPRCAGGGRVGTAMIFSGIALSRPMLGVVGHADDVIDQGGDISAQSILWECRLRCCPNFGAASCARRGRHHAPASCTFSRVAGIGNVALNAPAQFVIRFSMGVAGVALATIISQNNFCMAYPALPYAQHRRVLLLSSPSFAFTKSQLVAILRIGLPLQGCRALSSMYPMLIQSSINSFGSAVMAGNSQRPAILRALYIPP